MSNIRNTFLISATCVSLLFSPLAFAATQAPLNSDTSVSVDSKASATDKVKKKAAHKVKRHAKKAKADTTK